MDNQTPTLDMLIAPTVIKAVQAAADAIEIKLKAAYTERPISADQLKELMATEGAKKVNDAVFQQKLAEGMPFHTKGSNRKYFYYSEYLEWEHSHQKHLGGY